MKSNAAAARVRVQAAANGYCLCTYDDAYTGGTPRRLTLPAGSYWIVPVIFTSAGYGQVGEVGVLALEIRTLAVVDATAKDEVRSAGARLAREKRDDLGAAFRRARTT